MKHQRQALIDAASAEGILQDSRPLQPQARPWPVVLMTGLGAWLATVPLVIALFMMFGSALERSALSYLLGAAFLIGGIIILRGQSVSPFVEQLGLPLLLVGGVLFVLGLFRDLDYLAAELLLLTIVIAVAWWVSQHWLRVLLGALACATFIAMNTSHETFSGSAIGNASLMALVLCVLGMTAADRSPLDAQYLRPLILFEAMANGWLLLALVALMYSAGTTFLGAAVAAHWHGTRGMALLADDPLPRMLSMSMALAGAAWMALRWDTVRAPRFGAAAAILIVLAWLIPGLGAALLALAFCITAGRTRLAVASAIAAAWIVGSFYYQLDVTLAAKGAIMACMGAAFGVIAWLSWDGNARTSLAGTAAVGVASTASAPSAAPAAPATVATPSASAKIACRVGVAASLSLILVVANVAIWQKQDLISNGRAVFIKLAPADPRSLMQGDYMTLNFSLPPFLSDDIRDMQRLKVVARLDARGVATLEKLATDAPLAKDELVIELVRTIGGLRPASDAWYFKEGEAARWEQASYGEFRIDKDGRALLVNLRGEALEPL